MEIDDTHKAPTTNVVHDEEIATGFPIAGGASGAPLAEADLKKRKWIKICCATSLVVIIVIVLLVVVMIGGRQGLPSETSVYMIEQNDKSGLIEL
jgi:ABC-type Fe3+ transport system permease subunit